MSWLIIKPINSDLCCCQFPPRRSRNHWGLQGAASVKAFSGSRWELKSCSGKLNFKPDMSWSRRWWVMNPRAECSGLGDAQILPGQSSSMRQEKQPGRGGERGRGIIHSTKQFPFISLPLLPHSSHKSHEWDFIYWNGAGGWLRWEMSK